MQDFGQEPTDPALVDRVSVMERLIHCYPSKVLLNINDAPHRKDPSIGIGKNEDHNALYTKLPSRIDVTITMKVREEMYQHSWSSRQVREEARNDISSKYLLDCLLSPIS